MGAGRGGGEHELHKGEEGEHGDGVELALRAGESREQHEDRREGPDEERGHDPRAPREGEDAGAPSGEGRGEEQRVRCGDESRKRHGEEGLVGSAAGPAELEVGEGQRQGRREARHGHAMGHDASRLRARDPADRSPGASPGRLIGGSRRRLEGSRPPRRPAEPGGTPPSVALDCEPRTGMARGALRVLPVWVAFFLVGRDCGFATPLRPTAVVLGWSGWRIGAAPRSRLGRRSGPRTPWAISISSRRAFGRAKRFQALRKWLRASSPCCSHSPSSAPAATRVRRGRRRPSRVSSQAERWADATPASLNAPSTSCSSGRASASRGARRHRGATASPGYSAGASRRCAGGADPRPASACPRAGRASTPGPRRRSGAPERPRPRDARRRPVIAW